MPKPSNDELTSALNVAIKNFHSPDSDDSLATIQTSLTGLLANGVLNALVWANYVHGIHHNSELSEDNRETLFTVFASFTGKERWLFKYLSEAIRQPKDGDEDSSIEGDLDTEVDDSEAGDSEMDNPNYDHETGVGGRSQNAEAEDAGEPEQSWQERVGTKILEIAPYLIAPPPLPVGSKGYNVNKSNDILKIAVMSNADWVIPPNLTHLNTEHQERIKAYLDPQAETETLLEIAVGLGHLAMIKRLIQLLKAVGIDQTERGEFLKTAINDKRPEIAILLVEEYPEMIEQTPNGVSALQTLRRAGSFPRRAELEDFLISKILRRKPPALVRKLLAEQTGQSEAKELYADFTVFNDLSNHNFDTFLESLKDINKYLVQFISTLMYVEMPRMRDKPANSNREEAFMLLNWLRARSVRTILELHVPDSLSSPHPEEGIQRWLSVPASENGFKEIEVLNWEKLDMSLETLKLVPGLRKVYLYSDNWNTLAFWTGAEGLCCNEFEKITEINIVIVQDNISIDRAKYLEEQAKKRLKARVEERKLRILAEGRTVPPFIYKVEINKWNVGDGESHRPEPPPNMAVTPKRITDLERFLKQDPRQITLLQQPRGPASLLPRGPRPARVAIIDNGIDAGISRIWERVVASRSFVDIVEETRESSCWLASDSHGTQMASIVTDIDQHCLLYIAKVGTHNKPKPDDVAEAIRWAALSEQVDIIIISMTFDDNHKSIKDAVSAADQTGTGPVIFCATEDVGNAGKEVYPAYLEQTIAISACSRAGKGAKYTDTRAAYYFQGYEIHADCLSYSTSKSEAPRGSSVATAIAGGVASLILSLRYEADPEGRSQKSRKVTIEKVFEDMREGEDKYVFPRRFFKAGYGKDRWSTAQWDQWIKNTFRPGFQYV